MTAFRIGLVAVAALGMLACNGGHPLGPPNAPPMAPSDAPPMGPRIVPWQLETDGAPTLVMGSYDTREKVHCVFLHDEKGVLRCLPPVPHALRETAVFADAACQSRVYTEVLGAADANALGQRAVTVPLPRADCEPRRHAMATLAARPAGAAHFGGTPCAPTDFRLAPGEIELVAEQTEPSDRWATGTEVDGPLLPGGVRVRQFESAEGTRVDAELLDETLGHPCRIDSDYPNGFVCSPPNVAFAAANEGTDCMGPTVWAAPACTDVAYLGGGANTFAVGPRWLGPVSLGGHGCGPYVPQISPDGPEIYFEAGPPEAPFVAPPVAFPPAGTGRLQLREPSSVDGQPVALGGDIGPPHWWTGLRYFDTVANQDCDAVWTPEGLVRCIPTTLVESPSNYYLADAFADAACMVPARYCPTATGCGGQLVVSVNDDPAYGELHAVALHHAVDLPWTYVMGSVGCERNPYDSPHYVLGSEALPWDPYPAFVEDGAVPAS